MQLTLIGIMLFVGFVFLLAHMIWNKLTLAWSVLALLLIELVRLVPVGK